MPQAMINTYVCDKCNKSIVTTHRDPGTTSMFLVCRATKYCTGRSISSMYRVPQDLTPQWEWYKPKKSEIASLSPETLEHVSRGGLLLREIN